MCVCARAHGAPAMCMHVQACVLVCMHMGGDVCVGQKLTSGSFLKFSSLCLVTLSLPLSLELTHLASLASQFDPEISPSQLSETVPHVWLLHGCWGPKLKSSPLSPIPSQSYFICTPPYYYTILYILYTLYIIRL